MDEFCEGRMVIADFQKAGRHPGIILNTKEEIDASGMALVVLISANTTRSLLEDLIEVPKRLGLTKKCFVHFAEVELLPKQKIEPKSRKAWGPFLKSVQHQARIAKERKGLEEKQTQQ